MKKLTLKNREDICKKCNHERWCHTNNPIEEKPSKCQMFKCKCKGFIKYD